MAQLMVASVYHALLEAGASQDRAREAAEDVAAYDSRFGGLEVRMERVETRLESVRSEVGLLKWMLGANLALTIGVLVRLFFQ